VSMFEMNKHFSQHLSRIYFLLQCRPICSPRIVSLGCFKLRVSGALRLPAQTPSPQCVKLALPGRPYLLARAFCLTKPPQAALPQEIPNF
jgi:hypothetical protein